MPHDAPNTIDLSAAAGFGVELDQYFGLWAVHEESFRAKLDYVRQMDLASHVQHQFMQRPVSEPERDQRGADRDRRRDLATTGGRTNIAVIDINGTLTKRGSSLSGAAAMVQIRQQVRQARRDPEIDAAVLRIDSPGGTVAGTADLAAEIAQFAEEKPIDAFIEDMGASGAYWLASQARRIWANNATAKIGSIGTFTVLHDLSEMAEKEGIQVLVIRNGEFKGTGTPGTEITEAQQEYIQDLVDKTQREFTEGVARGRGMKISRARELADGRAHMAPDAADLDLIDGMRAFDDVLELVAEDTTTGANGRGARRDASGRRERQTEERSIMAENDRDKRKRDDEQENEDKRKRDQEADTDRRRKPEQEDDGERRRRDDDNQEGDKDKKGGGERRASDAPASVQELKAAFPAASAEDREYCLEQGYDMKDAAIYMANQAFAKLENREKQDGQPQSDRRENTGGQQAAPAKRPGGQGLKSGHAEAGATATSGDAVERFEAAVKANVDKGMTRKNAVRQVIANDPELHRAYLAERNDNRQANDQLHMRVGT